MPDPVFHMLSELTVLVGASAVIAYVGQRFFRVLPLVGFLITGIVIGPNALALVTDEHLVEGAAEVGVILLLFTIGIECVFRPRWKAGFGRSGRSVSEQVEG